MIWAPLQNNAPPQSVWQVSRASVAASGPLGESVCASQPATSTTTANPVIQLFMRAHVQRVCR